VKDEQIIRGVLAISSNEDEGVNIWIGDKRLDVLLEEKFGCRWQRSPKHPYPSTNRFYSIIGEVIIAKL